MAGLDPSVDPYEDPYFAWARAQQLAELQAAAPPMDPAVAPSPAAAAGRKGGSSSGPGRTQQIGPALSPGGEETPQQVTPVPDPDPMADADPRGDMTADQLAAPGTDVDAISSAAPAADVASMVQLDQEPAAAAAQAPAPTDAGYYDWARQQAAGQPLPSMQDKSMRDSAQAEIDAIGKMTPEEYIRFQGERAGHLRDMQTQRQAEIDAENQRQAQQAFQAQQAAIAKANADTADMMQRANDLANTKIVPKKAGLADVVGILLGGMFSGGGPNMALAQFNRKVDTDMQAQHENIANAYRGLEVKRGAIADELARHGDLYRASETYRLASYQAAINHMQTELQQYDPAGTTAMTIRNGIDQFHNAQMQAAQAANKQLIDDNLKRAQTAQAMAGAFKTAAETDKLKASMGGGAAAPAKILPPEYYKGLGLMTPPQPMSVDAYKAWLELSKTGAEADKAAQDAGQNKTETIGGVPTGLDGKGNVTYGVINNADGSPLKVDKTTRDKVAPMIAGADKVNRLANRLSREISAWGGQSDIKKNHHWQTIQSDYQDLIFALHEVKGIEGFRPGTADLLHELTGNVDPTSFVRDATPGILRAKQNVIEDTDATLRRVANYNGPAFSLPDTSKPPDVAPTDVDGMLKSLGSKDDSKSVNRSHQFNVELDKLGRDTPEAKRALALGLKPSEVATLDRLYQLALDGDENARAALEAVAEGKTPGSSKELRSHAHSLVAGALAVGISSGEP